MKISQTKKLVLSAMFLAIALILPFFTGQIPQIGSMLLPMHLPVLLCGFLCGGGWGAGVGLLAPLLRSVLFQMPPMYPTAVAMAVEMAVYGLVCGLLYILFKNRGIIGIYCSLIPAMLVGRLVWGVTMLALLGVKGEAFTWAAFLSGAFIKAVPGIILQLILIPTIMFLLQRSKALEGAKS